MPRRRLRCSPFSKTNSWRSSRPATRGPGTPGWGAEAFREERLLLHDHLRGAPLQCPPKARPFLEAAGEKISFPGSTEAAVALVRSGVGVVLMPSWSARGYAGLSRTARGGAGLSLVRLTEGGIWMQWFAATRPGAPPYAEAFARLVAARAPEGCPLESASPGDGAVAPAPPSAA